MTQPINTVVRRLPRPLKVMDRSLQKAVSPSAARQIVEGRRIDTSKIYKGGASPTVPPLPHKFSGITPHSVGGDASNTVTGPASIAELARALKNDPQLIYEWVHNNIDWDPGWGLLKGAFGTLVGGRGNSFDQSALMVALLRAAGYTANYVLGTIQVSAADAGDWFGTVSDNIDMANQYCFYNYIPVDYIWNPIEGAYDITIGHVWVQCVIGSTTYVFDPSRKSYNRTAAALDLSNLAAAMGYNSATFLTAARSGATIDPSGNWVQNINQSNVDSSLAALSMTLANWMKTNHPGATLNDVLGGAEIVPVILPVLQTTLPYELAGDVPTVWTGDVPISYKTTFEFAWPDANIDQTFTSEQLAGSRLTIWWTISGTGSTPTLYLNGTAVQTGTEIPTWMFVTYPNYIVTHNAFYDTNANENAWLGIDSGVPHLLATVWGNPGRSEADYHRKQLTVNSAAGGLGTDEPLLGETFAFLWSTQCAQYTAILNIMCRLQLVKGTTFHGVGVITHNGVRPGMGIASYLGSQVAIDYSTFAGDRSLGGVYGMIGSGLECAIFQQVVDNIPSINTGAMIRAENAAGHKIYQGTASNWTSVIEPALWANGYTSADTNDIYNNFVNWGTGATVEIPEHRNVSLGAASGYGFWFWPNGTPQGPGGIVNYSKGGGGGEPQTEDDMNKKAKKKKGPEDWDTSDETREDPVEFRKGDYSYSRTDLTVGQNFPYGLAFQRFYNSRDMYEDGALGYGWTHNFDISVSSSSDPYLALGQQQALPLVSSLVAYFVIMDLCSGPVTTLPLDKHVIASLSSSWWVDQVTQNTVLVKGAGMVDIFVKLPDGTYTSLRTAATLSLSGGIYTLTTAQKVVYTFNSSGQIATIAYPSGVIISFNYLSGSLQSVTNGMGRTLTLNYTAGRISSVSDGTGRSAVFAFDSSGNLSTATDAGGKATTYAYDVRGRMTQIFLPANPTIPVVTNFYDSLNRVFKQNDVDGNSSLFYLANSRSEVVNANGKSDIVYFDNNGCAILKIDAFGKKTTKQYDGLARLIKTIEPEGNSFSVTYDSKNNIITTTKTPKPGSPLSPITQSFTYHPTYNVIASATNGRGKTTTYNYDPLTGNLLSIVSPTVGGLTPQKIFTYNSYGQVVSFTDESGVVTFNTYYTLTSELASSILDYGGSGHLNLTTYFDYDSVGNLNLIKDPNGNEYTRVFDQKRRITSASSPGPFNYQQLYTYDDNNNLTKVQRETGDISNPWQTFLFNYLPDNRLLSTTDPSGNAVQYIYDNLRRVIGVIDAESSTTTYVYDDLNRLYQVIDELNNLVDTRQYNDNGTVRSITDARGNTTTYSYDGFDRIDSRMFPDASTERVYSYDAVDNPQSFKSRSGNTVSYTFDELNRISTINPQGQAQVSFTHDLSGRITKISKPLIAGDPSTGDSQFFFDTAGRFIKEQYPDLKTVTHQLDSNGNRTKTTWPDGYYVTRVYDFLNRLTDVKLNGASAAAVHFDYDHLSRRTAVVLSNGVNTAYSYALDSNQQSLTHSFVGSSVSLATTFNRMHQIANQSVTDQSFVWRPTVPGNTVYGAADTTNKYSLVGTSTINYDGNGNLQSDGVWTYTFDTENHLVGATKTGVAANYFYDGMHRQVQKVVGSVKSRFVYDGQHMIASYDGTTGILQNRFVMSDGTDEPLLSIDNSGNITFYHGNSQGSLIASTNNSGAVLTKTTYGPFGESGLSSPTVFGFTGQRFDAETGLYYYKTRYYSPNLGRFLQNDLAGYMPSLNMYEYCDNDPINAKDPLGLYPKQIENWIENNMMETYRRKQNTAWWQYPGLLVWWANNVRTNGAWDYKKTIPKAAYRTYDDLFTQGPVPPQWAGDIGNENFAATGKIIGIPVSVRRSTTKRY